MIKLFKIILNNKLTKTVFKYFNFILKVIRIYFTTFIELFKYYNPLWACIMFLVYVLNMATYFNSNLNFMGFYRNPQYLPSFATMQYWHNINLLPVILMTRQEFYRVLFELIFGLIIYSLMILFSIYTFFKLLVWFTDSSLFSFIITLQISTLVIITSTVIIVYTIIFGKKFLFDIGLTTWLKINLLNYKIKYFSLTPFKPSNKYLKHIISMLHSVRYTKDSPNLPFCVLQATSHNTFNLLDTTEINKYYFSQGSPILILPFTLFNNFNPPFLSDNHQLTLPFVPADDKGKYFIKPGKYYLLPTYWSPEFKYTIPSVFKTLYNYLFSQTINLNLNPIRPSLNVFKWLLQNLTFAMMYLLKLTPVFLFAGLVLLSVIVFINIFILFTGYVVSGLSDSSLLFNESVNYFFSFSQDTSTNCVSRNIHWLMAIYCGLSIGFVVNNIIDSDKFINKLILKIILTLIIYILVGKYLCYDHFWLHGQVLLFSMCGCRKCTCGKGACDCKLPSDCKDLFCTDKKESPQEPQIPDFSNYSYTTSKDAVGDSSSDSDVEESTTTKDVLENYEEVISEAFENSLDAAEATEDLDVDKLKLKLQIKLQIADLMMQVHQDEYYNLDNLKKDLALLEVEEEMELAKKLNAKPKVPFHLTFNLFFLFIWLFTYDFNFINGFVLDTAEDVNFVEFFEILFETFLPSYILYAPTPWKGNDLPFPPNITEEEGKMRRAKTREVAQEEVLERQKASLELYDGKPLPNGYTVEDAKKLELKLERLHEDWKNSKAGQAAKYWKDFNESLRLEELEKQIINNEVPLSNDFDIKEIKVRDLDIKVYKPQTKTFETVSGLQIPGLLIHFNLLTPEFLTTYEKALNLDVNSIKEVMLKIQTDIAEVKSLNKDGYINETDVTNLEKYPLLGGLVNLIIKDDKKLTKSNERLDAITYAFNLFMLNHYTLTTTILNSLKKTGLNVNTTDEAFSELQVLNKTLLGFINNSIKRHFNKTGIGITNNIFAGLDTEYVNVSQNLNKLLSVQLSVSGNFNIKVPSLETVYEFGTLDVDSNKFYTSTPKGDNINYDLIKTLIQDAVNFNKINSFGYYLLYIDKVIKKLMKVENINFKIKEGFYHFKLPMTKIKTTIFIQSNFELKQAINEIIKLDSFSDVGSTLPSEKEFFANKIKKLLSVDETEILNDTLNFPTLDLTLKDNRLLIEEGDNLDVEGDLNYSFIKGNSKVGGSMEQIYLGIRNNIYLAGHYNAADLPMFSDFESDYKHKLDIVNKSFTTLKKPLTHFFLDNEKSKWNVRIYDTYLLAPPGQQKLSDLGKLYKFPKMELTEAEISNMEDLLHQNPQKFKDYAIRDSEITLLHLCNMTDYYFELGGIVPPLTLPQISGKAFENYWKAIGYKDYQISPQYLLTNTYKGITPKGLFVLGDVGEKLPMYIQTYKGGRNESYMYGVDNSDNTWFDYDLAGAYTTVMFKMFNPIYTKAKTLTIYDFNHLIKNNPAILLEGYYAIKCDFVFPTNTKFPCLPCNYDEDNSVYPLKGKGVFTGIEILAAINMGCIFTFKDIFHIPWGNIKPFGLIKDLQAKRALHPKDSFENLMCKLIGNGAYGIVSQGINAKMKFDTKSGDTIRMEGSIYSNPILAAWITALIRCVLGELIHNTNKIGGIIISATTDGFITNIKNLENVLLENDQLDNTFLNIYRNIRDDITNGKNPNALEVKKEGKGMLTWTTRGQLSVGAKIAATTGLQRYQISEDLAVVHNILLELFKSNDKSLEFHAFKLRSALDVFKFGGHVTRSYSEKVFSIFYDNKRLIIDKDDKGNNISYLNQMLDTSPHQNVDNAKLLRGISKLTRTTAYNQTEERLSLGVFKSNLDLTIKSWVKALTHNQLNLEFNRDFNSVDELLKFILKFDPKYLINRQNIYVIKSRRPLILKTINKTTEGIEFINYVKSTFPLFDENNFWK